VLALPMLLKELKENGYKIVQAVPMGDRPAAVPERPVTKLASSGWPRILPQPDPRNASEETSKEAATPRKAKYARVGQKTNESTIEQQPQAASSSSMLPSFVAQ
jgi:hypothetical protein